MVKAHVYTAYQLASYIVKNGFAKIRTLKLDDGQFRYQVKGLTESEWSIYEWSENLTPAEVEARIEDGWVILDAFTASAVKQVYEALEKSGKSDLTKFDRIPFEKLATFAFKMAR